MGKSPSGFWFNYSLRNPSNTKHSYPPEQHWIPHSLITFAFTLALSLAFTITPEQQVHGEHSHSLFRFHHSLSHVSNMAPSLCVHSCASVSTAAMPLTLNARLVFSHHPGLCLILDSQSGIMHLSILI